MEELPTDQLLLQKFWWTHNLSPVMDHMFLVEGDGVCEHLYEYVWCKDERSFRPQINIPDTVVYKFGQPIGWYFTSADGRVKKKLKTNMINSKIEDAFIKANTGSDVTAYFISWMGNSSRYHDGAFEASVSNDIPEGRLWFLREVVTSRLHGYFERPWVAARTTSSDCIASSTSQLPPRISMNPLFIDPQTGHVFSPDLC